MTLPTSD